MNIQEEREAFESWCEKEYLFTPEFNQKRNIYKVAREHSMWLAWQAAKAQAVPEWISIEDSLPKKNANVLLNVVARRRGKPLVCIGFYSIEPDDDPCFVLDDKFTVLKGVTHWMMLPQPPKAQEPAND